MHVADASGLATRRSVLTLDVVTLTCRLSGKKDHTGAPISFMNMAGRIEQIQPGSSHELTSFTGGALSGVEAPPDFTIEGDKLPDAPAGDDTTSDQISGNPTEYATGVFFGRTVYLTAYTVNDKLRVQDEAHSIATILSGDAYIKHMEVNWKKSNAKWPPLVTSPSGRFHWIHLPVNDFDSVKVRPCIAAIATTDPNLTAY